MTIAYPNDRRNPAGAIPVYMVGGPGTPDARGRLPNIQNNPNGAIPVIFGAQPTEPDAGAIPVYVVAGPGTPDANGRFPNDQSLGAGAIPVYNSTSPKAMPVWNAAPVPPPPIINPATFTNPLPTTFPTVLGICTCQNGPATWSIINPGGLALAIAAGSGQLIIMSANGLSTGTYDIVVQASNTNGFDQEHQTLIFT